MYSIVDRGISNVTPQNKQTNKTTQWKRVYSTTDCRYLNNSLILKVLLKMFFSFYIEFSTEFFSRCFPVTSYERRVLLQLEANKETALP